MFTKKLCIVNSHKQNKLDYLKRQQFILILQTCKMHEKENNLNSLTCHFHGRSLNITYIITRVFNAIYNVDGAMHDWST